MRTFLSALCVAALLASAAAPAVAAPAKPKIKRFILDGSEIEGALVRPDGKWLVSRIHPKPSTLIEYRVDFNDQMVKLVDEL